MSNRRFKPGTRRPATTHSSGRFTARVPDGWEKTPRRVVPRAQRLSRHDPAWFTCDDCTLSGEFGCPRCRRPVSVRHWECTHGGVIQSELDCIECSLCSYVYTELTA